MKTPATSFLIYGDSGAGKSTFAATFPKPALVLQTDPYAKGMPYRRKGIQGESGQIITASGMEDKGGVINYDDILHAKTEKLMFRLERYNTEDIHGGTDYIYGFENILARFSLLRQEIKEGKWATVIFDSLTSLEFEVRKLHQYKLNPESKSGAKQDARQWYGASAQAVEELCYGQLTWLPCNVVVLAHIKEDKDNIRDTLFWTPAAPGAQGRRLPGCFAEAYVIKKIRGQEESILQTRSDADYMATSQIPAPNPCVPTYKAIWELWEKEMKKEEE